MRKICVFTGTRAEYGILKPLLNKIKKSRDMRLQILVSGMHLSPEFGLTYQEIENDGFAIDEKIEILLSSDSPQGIYKSAGLGIIGFGDALRRLAPDILLLLGDRFEAFSAAAAAMISRIPIAHVHGGETTFGAIDEPMRHAITKMSHLHFTSTEKYRQRVIQLGENPGRVFNVGALGVENIRTISLLDRRDLEKELAFSLNKPFVLVTFHPVTMEKDTAGKQFRELTSAFEKFPKLRIIFTKANADTEGRIINTEIDNYVASHPERSTAFTSMGQIRYLSAMRLCTAVVGNSSSGIIEAPSFGIPTINIGDRQKGRIRATSLIDCDPDQKSIVQALKTGLSASCQEKAKKTINPYAGTDTAKNITKIIKEFDLTDIVKKEFYDLPLQTVS